MGTAPSTPKRLIHVFIASPGDLAEERRAFKETIDELNKGFGRGANVEFVPLGWEDALALVGRRSQSVINQDVDTCDAFILVMWRRWGQEAPDAAPYSSYTEEEFYRALRLFENAGRPEIFVFFKHIDPGQMADPGPQLTKILEFRKKLESTRQVLYRGFKTIEEFRNEIDTHLVAFATGRVPTPGGMTRVPLLPDSVALEVEKHKGDAQRAVNEIEKLKAEMQRLMEEAERARAEAKSALARAEAAENVTEAKAARRSVELAEQAARAALEGNVEEARQDFAKALDGTTNLRVLGLGAEFFARIGEHDEAERLARRRLAICGPDAETADTAEAYSALADIICGRPGDLSQAEEMYRKALGIAELLKDPERMSIEYTNLGILFELRGELEQSEEMHRKAMVLDEALGDKYALARDYSNLGTIYRKRKEFDNSEGVLKKALELDEGLGLESYVATDYLSLGALEVNRGELDKAEELLRKSLEVSLRGNLKQFSGRAYEALGVVALRQSQPDKARELMRQAEAIYRQLSMSKDRDRCASLIARLDRPQTQ
ncbi:tetratricopeptide repeat protein [Pyxidicoccus trucidator]|uniref:tetratricopeptide repeat protein n=1 Tax=Pyxidicoccus trucidator TaxID=2709662 RepID=UPI0023DDEFFD|nr:tetratricopeptide repeat protein [Pyxidicoccus trucidator]